MKGALQNRNRWLLIYDNADDPVALADALPQRGGHIIITSRNPNWDNKLDLGIFNSRDAVKYLKIISGISEQENEAAKLADKLGFLPLALTQAGAYIKQQKIDIATYLATYKQGEKQLLTKKEKGCPRSVAMTWALSMEKMAQKDPNAIHLLNYCSYLAPDNIPEALLKACLEDKIKKETGSDFHDALEVLESYSMITQKVEIFREWRS